MTDIRGTLNFKIIKWILFVVCLIYILLMILLMFMSGRIADYLYDEYAKTEQQSNINSRGRSISGTKYESPDEVDPEAVKNIVKIFIIIVAIISIIVYSFGLIGTYKEHLCLTLTFAILMSIGTLLSIVSFLITFKNFGSLLISLTITILAFAFARDLHRSRAQMGAHPMVTIQTTQPMLQTVIPLYPNTVIGQPYPQQQQQQYNAGMGVYGGPPLVQQQPPNYSDVPPYMPSGLQNDYPTK